MTNEFLKRCRELSKIKCRAVHTSPGYIKLLDHADGLQRQLDDYEHDIDIYKSRIQRLEATVRVLQADLQDNVTGD